MTAAASAGLATVAGLVVGLALVGLAWVLARWATPWDGKDEP